MLGHTQPVGPGGRNCSCCYPPPGKARKKDKRTAKRKERQAWRKEENRDA